MFYTGLTSILPLLKAPFTVIWRLNKNDLWSVFLAPMLEKLLKTEFLKHWNHIAKTQTCKIYLWFIKFKKKIKNCSWKFSCAKNLLTINFNLKIILLFT